MKKNLQFLFFLLLSYAGNCQCNIVKLHVQNDVYRYTMSETYHQNDDLQNGLKMYIVSVNDVKDIVKDNTIFVELVITFAYTEPRHEMIPNKTNIMLPSGKLISLTAKEKSRNTINQDKPSPGNTKTWEGVFELQPEDVVQIVKEKEIRSMTVLDYRNPSSYVDITPKYRGQLAEQFMCVMKKG